jgi:hypothetical protein
MAAWLREHRCNQSLSGISLFGLGVEKSLALCALVYI